MPHLVFDTYKMIAFYQSMELQAQVLVEFMQECVQVVSLAQLTPLNSIFFHTMLLYTKPGMEAWETRLLFAPSRNK